MKKLMSELLRSAEPNTRQIFVNAIWYELGQIRWYCQLARQAHSPRNHCLKVAREHASEIRSMLDSLRYEQDRREKLAQLNAA
jgi:hypothetical protein